MSHLILHIGCHKTGTSSLQSSLLKSHAELNEHGWMFATLDRFGNSSNLIKSEYKNGHLELALSVKFEEFLKNNQGNLILSGEHFSLLDMKSEKLIKKVQNLCSIYFKKTTIVIYLRRQDKLALSLKQQAAKGNILRQMASSQLCGHSDLALPELTDDMKSYLNFNDKIRLWASYFGRESLCVRLFEKDKLVNGDICADFSHALNLPLKLKSLRVNEGVTRLFSLCSHLLIRSKFEPSLINNVRAEMKNNPTCSTDKIEVAKGEAIEFYQHFKKDNDILFNWLGMEERFCESFEEYPEQGNYSLTQSELTLLFDTIAVCSQQTSNITVNDINNIRDCALYLEDVDLTKAQILMEIAGKIRPNGKLIKQKLAIYKKLSMSD